MAKKAEREQKMLEQWALDFREAFAWLEKFVASASKYSQLCAFALLLRQGLTLDGNQEYAFSCGLTHPAFAVVRTSYCFEVVGIIENFRIASNARGGFLKSRRLIVLQPCL